MYNYLFYFTFFNHFQFSKIINNCIAFLLYLSTVYDNSNDVADYLPSKYDNTDFNVAVLLNINVIP